MRLGVVSAVLASSLAPWGDLPVSQAAPSPHAAIVPEKPATGYPVILNTPTYTESNTGCPAGCTRNREVLAADQVGRNIVAGGNFHAVELADGEVVQQKFFAAWNVDTKQPTCMSKLTFDDEVRSVAQGPASTKAYVVGRFAKVTGADGVARARSRVAMVNLADCSVDKTFIPSGINGRVDEIAVVGNRVFIGGEFTAAGGQAIETVAELDATTGALNLAFNFTTSGELNGRVKGLAVNTAGTRLVLAGRFGTITREASSIPAPTAVIDISDPASPRLTDHRSSGYVTLQDLLDASVSPDASVVGLTFGTANTSDYVYLTPLTESAVAPRWRHTMRDSTFGVAVTNTAMYVGGHFCKIDAGPGTSNLLAPKMGLDTCSGTTMFTGGVWRSHLAALSLTDGTPLDWNPGQDSFTGSQRMTMTTRGLLVGFDGSRTNSIRTGALAFFDFGPTVEDTTPPGNVTYTKPTAGGTFNNPVTVAGRATDNVAVAKYASSVMASDGRWLQADGTLGATKVTFTTPALPDGSYSRQFVLPAGTFTVTTRAIDIVGLRSLANAAIKFVASGTESELPIVTVGSPASKVVAEKPFVVAAVMTDNTAIASAVAAVRSPAGEYLQPDGSFAAAASWRSMTATAGTFNTKSVTATVDYGSMVRPGVLSVIVRATDSAGNVTETTRATEVTLAGSVAPAGAMTNPPASITKTTAVTINGTATDNLQVADVRLTVANAAGQFVRADGTLGAEMTPLTPTVVGRGTPSASFSLGLRSLPESTYTISATITDWLGNSTVVQRVFTVVGDVTAVTGVNGGGFIRGADAVGFTFSVNTATTVTALGVFDGNGNGVLDNPAATRVGIWNRSTNVQIAETTVARNAIAESRWFYGTLATPLTLQPGQQYIIVQETFTNGEQHSTGTTATVNGRITISGWAMNGWMQGFGGWGFPWNQGFGSPRGIPSFKFRT